MFGWGGDFFIESDSFAYEIEGEAVKMIYIILDSNMLHIDYKNNFIMNKLFFSESVNDLIKRKKQGRFDEAVRILVPEVVLREIKRQRIEAYEKFVLDVEKVQRSIAGYGKVELRTNKEEYRRTIDLQFSNWLEVNEVQILPICEETYFYQIVNDAIEKLPPFEGKEKQSDKGFKDVLIFYSIISYAKVNAGNYFFWTNDNMFTRNEARDNFTFFETETGCRLKVIKRIDEMLTMKEKTSKEKLSKEIDRVEYRYKEKEYVWKNNIASIFATVTHSYPIIVSPKEIADIVNEDINNIILDDRKYWEDLYKSSEDGLFEDCEGNLKVIVTYNENSLLCIRFMGDLYLGGVVNPTQIGRAYNLSTGDVLGLTQLLGKTENEIIKLAIQKFEEDKQSEPDKYWDDFEPKFKREDDINFYVNKDGIFVFFEVYDAGCGAEGNIEFKLADMDEILVNIRG